MGKVRVKIFDMWLQKSFENWNWNLVEEFYKFLKKKYFQSYLFFICHVAKPSTTRFIFSLLYCNDHYHIRYFKAEKLFWSFCQAFADFLI